MIDGRRVAFCSKNTVRRPSPFKKKFAMICYDPMLNDVLFVRHFDHHPQGTREEMPWPNQLQKLQTEAGLNQNTPLKTNMSPKK